MPARRANFPALTVPGIRKSLRNAYKRKKRDLKKKQRRYFNPV